MTRNALIPTLSPEGSLSRYMEQIRQFPMLEADEEYMLAPVLAERGDVDAAHKLVTSHLQAGGQNCDGLSRIRPACGGSDLRGQSGHDACGKEI